MLRELEARINDGADNSVRGVLITGAGRAFCSGGDLSGEDTAGAGHAANDVVSAIVDLPKPVVAGVHGPASGFGCSLALACDLVVASEAAYFQLAFVKVGLMPDGGASELVPTSIGRQRAARMALLAERISAATAYEWGLISHLVATAEFDDSLAEVATSVATGPTLSYQWIKRALRTTTLPALADAQSVEAAGQEALARTQDFRRAVAAFQTRATPVFEGN